MDDIIDLSGSALCVTDDQVSGAAFQPFKPYNLIAFGYPLTPRLSLLFPLRLLFMLHSPLRMFAVFSLPRANPSPSLSFRFISTSSVLLSTVSESCISHLQS